MFSHAGRSSFLDSNSSGDLGTANEVLRSWFTSLDIASIAPYQNHTHGDSASKRSVGSNFIEDLARVSGKPVTYFQGSAADLRKGRDITRDWFWAKDMTVPLTKFSSEHKEDSNRIVAMVDVDEHLEDLPAILARHLRPYLFYSFVPSRAAKDKGDYVYRFLADGSVEYVVSGGGTYRHKIWDYGSDSLKVVENWHWTLSGPLKHVAYYKVERRNIDADHQVILLMPMKQWTSPQLLPCIASAASMHFEAPPLKRMNPVKGDFVRVQTMTPEGLKVSTAGVGKFSEVTVTIAADDETKYKSDLTGGKLTIAMAKATMAAHKLETCGAEILTAYHRANAPVDAPRVFKTGDSVRTYQFLPELADYDPEVKPSMSSFMKPLVDGAFAPAMCKGNDKRAVSKRITEVRTRTVMTPFLKKMQADFVDMMIEELGIERNQLFPLDYESVLERQPRPSQRRIFESANYSSRSGEAQTFMKRECYGKVADPRLITPIDGMDKMVYSSYIYALYDVIKKCHWFMSGMKPVEVATHVAGLAEFAAWMAETDFSRMDGRVSDVPRNLETELMMAFFAYIVHEFMLKAMRSQTWLKCRTKFGETYNTEYARASGSAETTAFNTILAAFTVFLAFRLDGFGKREAYYKIGACQGDDGATPDLKASKAEEAAKMVGQKLKVNIVPRGQIVTFLSRHYGPDVWFGENDSCCDVLRQITKFHCSVVVQQDKNAGVRKLSEKAFAFYLTDENTPVLGKFVQKVLQFRPVSHEDEPGKLKYENINQIWNSDIPKDAQYPSLPDTLGWKRALVEKTLPGFSIADFDAWVDSCDSIEKLMDHPDPVVIDAEHPGGTERVVVDDNVLEPPTETPAVAKSRRGKRGGKRFSKASAPAGKGKENRPSNVNNPQRGRRKGKSLEPRK